MSDETSASTHSYYVDPETGEEMSRLMRQDRLVTRAMGGPLPEPHDLEKMQSILNRRTQLFDTEQDQITVFAKSARVPRPDPKKPLEQSVVLDEPVIVTYEPQTPWQKKEEAPSP